ILTAGTGGKLFPHHQGENRDYQRSAPGFWNSRFRSHTFRRNRWRHATRRDSPGSKRETRLHPASLRPVSNFEVPNPILNSPFEEPKEHWWILEGQPAERRQGRRPALYFYREPGREGERGGIAIEIKPVNRIRERVKAWRSSGYAGVTRTTLELLQWWQREGRERRLFFAQIEAVETIIFLVEARADFRQGVEIPR